MQLAANGITIHDFKVSILYRQSGRINLANCTAIRIWIIYLRNSNIAYKESRAGEIARARLDFYLAYSCSSSGMSSEALSQSLSRYLDEPTSFRLNPIRRLSGSIFTMRKA